MKCSESGVSLQAGATQTRVCRVYRQDGTEEINCLFNSLTHLEYVCCSRMFISVYTYTMVWVDTWS